jgi:hypothetical protein
MKKVHCSSPDTADLSFEFLLPGSAGLQFRLVEPREDPAFPQPLGRPAHVRLVGDVVAEEHVEVRDLVLLVDRFDPARFGAGACRGPLTDRVVRQRLAGRTGLIVG